MSTVRSAIAATALAVLAGGCGGGGDGGGGGGGSPPPPDLSGVWAGSWQGADPSLGAVSGTWEVEITQSSASASGPSVLLGLVDCMDGTMQSGAGTSTVNGSVTRAPCATVNWQLTAVETVSGTAAGSWTNAGTGGSGTLTGARVARLGSTRILHVHPPAGTANTIVTIRGAQLGGASGVAFNGRAAAFTGDATRIISSVPAGATTGPVSVMAAGNASSPRFFNTQASFPPALAGASVAHFSAPAAVAVSPDGRKFYVAHRGAGNGRVTLRRTDGLAELSAMSVTGLASARSIAASPDGKRVYVAVAGVGVDVMDAANLTVLQTFPLAIDDGGRDNPQGIAVSPDGTLLAVSSGSAGGNVTVLHLPNGTVSGTLALAAGLAPLGVAFSADGLRVFVAAADTTGSGADRLIVFVATDGPAITPSGNVAAGPLPTAIAVVPDGSQVFVSNQAGNSVSRFDAGTLSLLSTTPVGAAPTGITASPDSTRVYVASRGANAVGVLLVSDGSLSTSVNLASSQPIGIAMHPQGRSAYVASVGNSAITEVGGSKTLTVLLGGSGIGRVTSAPAGIDCGTACVAQFTAGSLVTLSPMAASGSFFSGWSGAADCNDSQVALSTDVTCTALFTANSPPPRRDDPPPSSCFIATAAYGSAMAPEVELLRAFRDRWLLTHGPGRAFVGFYYRHSPAFADAIRENDIARAAVRAALWPVVWSIKHPPGALLVVVALAGLVTYRRRKSASSA